MGENKGNRTIAIGLMLFALFFGAGNLIFPAAMGQAAGSNVWWAVLGFVVTGVGLPLAGVLAMGYSGCKNLQELASRGIRSFLHGHLLSDYRAVLRHSPYGQRLL